MSYKSENWKEKLQQVRAYGTFTEHKEGSVEEKADDLLNKEIEEELYDRQARSGTVPVPAIDTVFSLV